MNDYRIEPENKDHDSRCPLHEDAIVNHECRPEEMRFHSRAFVEWDDHHWIIEVRSSNVWFRIDFCPWCGEELDAPTCQCDELSEDDKEHEIDINSER